jgi:hypothetical protein
MKAWAFTLSVRAQEGEETREENRRLSNKGRAGRNSSPSAGRTFLPGPTGSTTFGFSLGELYTVRHVPLPES